MLLVHCVKLKSEERVLLNALSVLRAGGRKIQTLLQKHFGGGGAAWLSRGLFFKKALLNQFEA